MWDAEGGGRKWGKGKAEMGRKKAQKAQGCEKAEIQKTEVGRKRTPGARRIDFAAFGIFGDE